MLLRSKESSIKLYRWYLTANVNITGILELKSWVKGLNTFPRFYGSTDKFCAMNAKASSADMLICDT